MLHYLPVYETEHIVEVYAGAKLLAKMNSGVLADKSIRHNADHIALALSILQKEEKLTVKIKVENQATGEILEYTFIVDKKRVIPGDANPRILFLGIAPDIVMPEEKEFVGFAALGTDVAKPGDATRNEFLVTRKVLRAKNSVP